MALLTTEQTLFPDSLVQREQLEQQERQAMCHVGGIKK